MTRVSKKEAERQKAKPGVRRREQTVVLQPRDRQILRTVLRHRFLTREQLQRVIDWDCVTKINVRLRKLFDCNYLNRRFIPRADGSPPAVYSLGQSGVQVIRETSHLTESQLQRHMRQDRRLSARLLCHAVATSEFSTLILAAVRRNREFERLRWMNDRNLALTAMTSVGGLKPDGLLSYVFKNRRFNFFVEIDTGTSRTVTS